MPFAFDLKSQRAMSDNPLVRCGCGRDVNADMMLDVRPIATLTGWPESHRCDACVERLFVTEQVSRDTFYRAHNAPAHLVDFHAKRDKEIRDTNAEARRVKVR